MVHYDGNRKEQEDSSSEFDIEAHPPNIIIESKTRLALNDILSTAVELLDADFGIIELLDHEQQLLVIVAHYGFSKQFPQSFAEVSTDDNTCRGRAIRQFHRVMIEDVEKDELYQPYLEDAATAGYRAVQSTPLVNSEGIVIGILSTHYSEPMQLTHRDEQLIDVLARYTTHLIEQLHIEVDLEKRVEARSAEVK